MLYKRKKNALDPNRINNYNKFLCTLDSSSLHTKHPISSPESTSDLSENDIKTTIDKIVEQITQKYNTNNYSTRNFTGLNVTDSCCIKNIDPNYYQDITSHKTIHVKDIIKAINKDINNKDSKPYVVPIKIETPIFPPVEIKETIHIDNEINDIADILKLIEMYKLDPSIKYNINMQALHDIKSPLEDLNKMIGMTSLKNNIVDQILYFVQELNKNKNTNTSGDFMHTVIYGPPGTGKTEIAKIMGKIYSKIGVLSKGSFKKVTRSDLIAGYLGQTSIKTSEVIKEALGGVLFIDEAYALGNAEKKDSFAKECIDTLCEALSDNKDNLMVIIAGYEKELQDCFFVFNQGLESRFTWRFKTDEYNATDLYHIFLKMVNDIGWECEEKSQINADWFHNKKEYFKYSGRDIETILAKTKIAHSRRVFCKDETEKRKITLADLNAGFNVYLKNEEVKNRKNDFEYKKQLYNTLYS
jgi:SpoVK/Ycf46/Vps4 family AAA+-type ATPase